MIFFFRITSSNNCLQKDIKDYKTHMSQSRPYSSERLVINSGFRCMAKIVPVYFDSCQISPE